jgi:hypothetical protein
MADSFRRVPDIAGKPRKIANNTFRYTRADGENVIRLHTTDIAVQLPDGRVKLDTGGWKSVTTKDRLNISLGAFGLGAFYIYSNKGQWFVGKRPEHVDAIPFTDGMILPDAWDDPDARAQAQRDGVAAKLLKKQIRDFVKATLPDGVELPKPELGDCFICMAQRETLPQQGPFRGEGMTTHDGDTGHLLEHIREGYMHGTLIMNALRSGGWTDTQISFVAYRKGADIARVRKAVAKYLQKRLGLVY